MGKLAVFQERFRIAIHSGEISDVLSKGIEEGILPVAARMQVYQNNYEMTLAGLLGGVFPLTAAFVGEEFLRSAAKLFIKERPPKDPKLEQFGADFSSFLRGYPHAVDVIYVADLAALEWAVHELQHVKALDEGACPVETSVEGCTLNPNVRFIESDYPLLQLWMVGMGQLVPEAVHIESGGQNVAVILDGLEVKLSIIDEQELKAVHMLSTRLALTEEQQAGVMRTLAAKNIVITQ
tara:strand:- start:303 stop:1013 length:711 start_codon:yes stop_codon:yes gene_type:complete